MRSIFNKILGNILIQNITILDKKINKINKKNNKITIQYGSGLDKVIEFIKSLDTQKDKISNVKVKLKDIKKDIINHLNNIRQYNSNIFDDDATQQQYITLIKRVVEIINIFNTKISNVRECGIIETEREFKDILDTTQLTNIFKDNIILHDFKQDNNIKDNTEDNTEDKTNKFNNDFVKIMNSIIGDVSDLDRDKFKSLLENKITMIKEFINELNNYITIGNEYSIIINNSINPIIKDTHILLNSYKPNIDIITTTILKTDKVDIKSINGATTVINNICESIKTNDEHIESIKNIINDDVITDIITTINNIKIIDIQQEGGDVFKHKYLTDTKINNLLSELYNLIINMIHKMSEYNYKNSETMQLYIRYNYFMIYLMSIIKELHKTSNIYNVSQYNYLNLTETTKIYNKLANIIYEFNDIGSIIKKEHKTERDQYIIYFNIIHYITIYRLLNFVKILITKFNNNHNLYFMCDEQTDENVILNIILLDHFMKLINDMPTK